MNASIASIYIYVSKVLGGSKLGIPFPPFFLPYLCIFFSHAIGVNLFHLPLNLFYNLLKNSLKVKLFVLFKTLMGGRVIINI